jgi:hypothetical protein
MLGEFAQLNFPRDADRACKYIDTNKARLFEEHEDRRMWNDMAAQNLSAMR